MDKYSFNIKAEKIQKLVKKGEYEAVAQIADTVDWEEVKSVRLLTITSSAYEHIRDYKSAIELLQLAYEESAVGKRILYKLTGLAIADRDLELAQKYYETYLQEAPEENGRYLLRYLLAELKGEPLDKRIAILETYRKYEFEEEWAFRLAELYDEAGMAESCVKLCDDIILWFGVGSYVDEALKLKEKYAPLSRDQQEHRDNKAFYEQRYQNVVEEYAGREEALAAAEAAQKGLTEETEEEEEAEAVPAEAAAPEEPFSWQQQILLVEATSLEEAVPAALEKLSAYHEKRGEVMNKLTRIPALKLNALGLAAAKSHLEGKDVLIDSASALSEEVLGDLVHGVKAKEYPQVFVLADAPTELPYLDAQLGNYLKTEEDELPAIAISAPGDTVVIHLDEVLAEAGEEELSEEDSLGETKIHVMGEQKAAAVAEEKPKTEDAAPAPAEEAAPASANAAEAPAAATEETAPEEAAPAEENPAEEAAAAKEETPEETPGEYQQSTIEDFFREHPVAEAPKEGEILPMLVPAAAKEAAEKAEEALAQKADKIEEAVSEKAEEAEEAIAEQAEEMEEAVAEKAEEAEEAIAEKAEEMEEAVAEKVEEAEEVAGDFKTTLEDTLNFVLPDLDKLEEGTDQDRSRTQDITDALLAAAARAQEEEAKAQPAAVKPAEASQKEVPLAEEPQESPKAPESKPAEKPEGGMKKPKPGSMTTEAFVEYAMNYLKSIDCVLDKEGEEALLDAAQRRQEEGIPLTKAEVENMLEEAADLSEKKGGLFTKRYNKEGFLIVKGKYIN